MLLTAEATKYKTAKMFQLLYAPIGKVGERFVVAKSDAEQIATPFAAFESHDPQLVHMDRIASRLLELGELRPDSISQFLAYFMILESLLTHNPDPKDPSDSITRQVKNKVPLLNHRWSPALDYSAFQGMKEDAIWSKMYGYRSTLAHVDVPDFSRGDLASLGNHANAITLLKSTVKAVARLALIDPQLVADLKKC